jgi:phosphatidylinositol glycan class A protein
LIHAIHTIQKGLYDPLRAHERVKDMYAWSDVAERTERVYDRAIATPEKNPGERLARCVISHQLGPIPLRSIECEDNKR